MATTNFIAGETTIVADWANDVDDAVYNSDKLPLDGSEPMTGALTLEYGTAPQINLKPVTVGGQPSNRFYDYTGVLRYMNYTIDGLPYWINYEAGGGQIGYFWLDANGQLNISTSAPTEASNLTRKDYVDTIATHTAAPATAASTGTAGNIAYDATHIYVCIATDTWVRATLATW